MSQESFHQAGRNSNTGNFICWYGKLESVSAILICQATNDTLLSSIRYRTQHYSAIRHCNCSWSFDGVQLNSLPAVSESVKLLVVD
jgi:hypothetical protein